MIRAIAPIARMTVLEALRSRLFWLLGAAVLASFGLAAFLQQVALIEAREIQATIIAALARACGVFLVATFVVTSVVREFNDKVIDLMLAQPLPRWAYLLGKFAGFFVAAALVALALSLPLLFFAAPARVGMWTLSLACELLLVAAVSLFCVLTLTHVVPALATVFGFYVLARSIAAMQIIAATAPSAALSDRIADWLVHGIALLLPRLDLMTQSAWLVDAAPANLGHALLQTAIYATLIIAAALFDFQRKNF